MHRTHQPGAPRGWSLGEWLGRAGAAVVAAVAVLLAAPVTPVAAAAPAAPDSPGVARWLPPLGGRLHVTRAFLPPATRYGRGHRGVDLAAPPGSPVLSSGAGVVTFAGLLAGRGVVVVRTGPLRTTYEPLAPAVRVGSVVRRGQIIGSLRAGHLGCPAAACLHWGLLAGDEYRDPLALLRPSAVRLLPLDGGRLGGATASRVDPVDAPGGGGGGGVVAGGVVGGGMAGSSRAGAPTPSGSSPGGAVAVTGAGLVLASGAVAGTGAALRRRTATRPAAQAP